MDSHKTPPAIAAKLQLTQAPLPPGMTSRLLRRDADVGVKNTRQFLHAVEAIPHRPSPSLEDLLEKIKWGKVGYMAGMDAFVEETRTDARYVPLLLALRSSQKTMDEEPGQAAIILLDTAAGSDPSARPEDGNFVAAGADFAGFAAISPAIAKRGATLFDEALV